jgi:hypothetical protein
MLPHYRFWMPCSLVKILKGTTGMNRMNGKNWDWANSDQYLSLFLIGRTC